MLERSFRIVSAVLLVLAIVGVWARRDGIEPPLTGRFTTAPSPAVRDALAAHARAGRRITWSGEVAAMAAAAEPAREPGDRWRISVVSVDASLVGDALGPLDSLPAEGGTLTTRKPREGWSIAAPTGEAFVRAEPVDVVGRVVVLGRVGWESKFVIAALEEEGWGVDAWLSLGAQSVVQGDPRPRNQRHAAVVVLDTTAVRSANATDAVALARYVRGGGGLVLAGEGATWSAAPIRAIVPARATRFEAAATREFTLEPMRALPLHQLTGLRDDALLVESRDTLAAVAARRERAGRVVQSGYAETWLWRLQGEEEAMRDHRLWWSRLVGSVAAGATRDRISPDRSTNDRVSDPPGAPLAVLVQALGPASATSSAQAGRGQPLPVWLGLTLLVLLVGEWGSRRARGAA